MNLRELQIAFKKFLQDDAPVQFTATPLSSLNIYKKNYFTNLTVAIQSKFPVAYSYCYEKNPKIFHKYIAATPSINGNLDKYGDNFVHFLKDNNFITAMELASIDFTIFKSSNASFESPLDASALSSIRPEDFDRLKFGINQSLNIASVTQESYELWLQFNDNSSIVEHLKETAKNSNSSEHARVYTASWLYKEHIRVEQMPMKFYKCLEMLRAGANLLAATEKTLMVDSSFNLSDFLKFCFMNHLIVSYKYTR